MSEPELASALDRGLDAQPVPAPDQGAGAGRAGGRRLEQEEQPPDEVLKAQALGADGGGEAEAATEQRRHEADCPLRGRTWREPRAKGAGPMRRLGETRRTS
jgi:hypothetical protein